MSGSIQGHELTLKLLNEDLTWAELETELANPMMIGAFNLLISISAIMRPIANNTAAFNAILNSETAFNLILSSPDAMKIIAGLDKPTQILTTNSAAIKAVLDNYESFKAYASIKDNFTRLSKRVNATGSKLKGQVFNANGTFTVPSGIIDLRAFLNGNGGNGGVNGSGGGGAGGGGESKNVVFSSLPSPGDLPVVVGTGGGSTDTSFNGITAAHGINASGGTSGAAAGTTTGNHDLFYNPVGITGFGQFGNWSVKGGAGGEAGLVGPSGIPLVNYDTHKYYLPSGGFGIGSGGAIGSGGNDADGNYISNPKGGASGNGVGCGGAGREYMQSGGSGAGSAGIVIVNYIIS